MLSVFLQAQNRTFTKPHVCTEVTTPSLYNWKDIETKFCKRLHITIAECRFFFKYAAKWGYLKTDEYYNLVKEGSITKANAQQYWLNKLSYFEDVYKFKYVSATDAIRREEEVKNNGASTNKTMSSCNNLDFASGDLSDWVGQWNNQGTSGTTNNGQGGYGFLTVNGFNTNGFNSMAYVHELCTAGTDPNVPISRVAPGHTYSLRLGNDSASNIEVSGSQNQLPFFHQTISNTFQVTQANKTITYWYAVVLTQFNPNNHTSTDQPYFRIRMYDGSGNEIVCARYDVDALSAPSIGGFNTVEVQTNSFSGNSQPYDFFYKNWTPVLIPLNAYVGQNVTITFESSDCAGGGHSGYAYLAVDCAPQTLIVNPPLPCVGGNTTLTAPAGLATYNWSGPSFVSGSSSQIATVNTAGVYSVTMTTFANSGQTGCTLVLSDTVQPTTISPTASFTATTPCLHNAMQFTDNSVLSPNQGVLNSWSWNFGDGSTSVSNNPTNLYANTGTFVVTYSVTSSVGCSATYSAVVNVNPLPTSSFISDTVCKQYPTTFTNTSVGGSGYNWNFGDGSVLSTNQNPTHMYANSGTFVTTLTVTNSFNCQAVSTGSVIVDANAIVAFSTPTVCLGSNSVFNNTSTPTTNVVYSWNFGDVSNPADTSNLQNPTYTYPAVGTYTVGLNVTSTSGCVGSKTITVNVKPIPQVAVSSPAPLCWSDVLFSPTFTPTPNSGVTYSWTNNNTATGLALTGGTGVPPTFIAGINYTGANIFGVITVTPSLSGCVGPPQSYTVTVKPTPVVTHSNVEYCPQALVPADTIKAVPTNAAITWNTVDSPFIGLTTTSGSTLIPSFVASGSPTVAQSNVINISVNLNGCAGPPASFSITVDPYPIAQFSHSAACTGNATQFMDESVSGGSPISQWSWNFGTGTAFVKNPSFMMTSVGTHTVNLQVTTIAGCTDDTTESIYINPSATVDFSADSMSCTPLTTIFTDVVSLPVKSWNWSFGNGATVTYTTQTAAQQTYTNGSHIQNSYFTVSLTVVTDSGCASNITKTDYITIFPKPLAGFSWGPKDADIIDPTLHFYDQSIGASGLNAYNWNFGDMYETVDSLSYSTIANPTHIYSDQVHGDYIVTQVVQNLYGCMDSIKEVVVIKDAVTFYIPNAFSPNHDNTNDGFKGEGIGIKNSTYNLWIFDRWGLLIFHATDIDHSWDGKVNGQTAQEDVYVWKVSFYDDFNKQHDYHGTVTLLK
ncbi:MAG TPA: PKD domain-containing protein [Bacteroidia bacterium]|nr:PKD domain-containing protein [Bacteroidia bacterium]